MENYTPFNLKFQFDVDYFIEITDNVYTVREVVRHLDISKYFKTSGRSPGRPSYDPKAMLSIVLLAFMEEGYCSLRKMVKLCRTDIRYISLLDNHIPPSHMTFCNFINSLDRSIEDIFTDINKYIFEKDHVDLDHTYIDGTKIIANANRYTWVWKKSCVTSRDKVFRYMTDLISEINVTTLAPFGVKMTVRDEYCIDYVEELLFRFKGLTGINEADFKSGRGHRKSLEQRQYQKMKGYCERLKCYAQRIETCGEGRNSYSKTDHDATFMRYKRDYMGNDQLLPAYNMQIAVCDEYIAVIDAQKRASDMDCFIPLMEKYKTSYGKYPKYPVADAGYGSYNNYLYCEQVGMEKYMKFTMYDKTVNDSDYREDPYRAVNFKRDEDGDLICPNGKKFIFKRTQPVKGNRYERTEEIYECEDCSGCPYKSECTRSTGNRTVQMNRELTSIHEEVLENLESIHGALLKMNRSIQAEGVFGIMKWNRSYKRANRRGIKSIILEFTLIACGFNLYKYHNKKEQAQNAA